MAAAIAPAPRNGITIRRRGRTNWMSWRRTRSSSRKTAGCGLARLSTEDGRQGLWLALGVDTGQRRFPFCNQHAVAQQLVTMIDAHRRRALDDGPQGQEVVEVHRTPVLHLDPGNDKIVTLVLDVLVGMALRPKQLDAALLEIEQIVRLVQQAHAIRLGVADANGDLPGGHRLSLSPRQSANAAGTAKWIVHQQCPAQQEALRHQAPAAAVRAGRAVVAQTEEMPRLNVQRTDWRRLEARPLLRI